MNLAESDDFPGPGREAIRFFPAIALFYLLVYSAAYTTRYAVTDDYLFLAAIRHYDSTAIAPLLLEGGRPLLAILALGVARVVHNLGDLAWVRALGVAGIGVFGALVFHAFRRERHPLWLALLAALTVGLLPAFQVFAAWAVCAFYPYAAALGGAAFLVITGAAERAGIVLRTVGATALLTAALAIYQPSAMAFWSVAAIWALSRPRLWNRRVIGSAVVAFGCAMLLDFAASKLLPAVFDLSRGLPRTALTQSPWHKLVWFVREPLTNAASLFSIAPSIAGALVVGGAVIIGAFAKYRERGGDRLFVLALLLAAAYVPNLVVAEDWGSYRTTPGLGGVVLFAFLVLVVGPLGRRLRARAAFLALPLIVGPLALSAAANVVQTYAVPSSGEYLLIRGAVVAALKRLPPSGSAAIICISPAEWQDTLSPVSRYDEFGVVSSSVPEVLQAIVGDIAASAESARERPRVAFHVIEAGAPLAGCDARVDVGRLLRDARPGRGLRK